MHQQAHFFLIVRISYVVAFGYQVDWVAEPLARLICAFRSGKANLGPINIWAIWLLLQVLTLAS